MENTSSTNTRSPKDELPGIPSKSHPKNSSQLPGDPTSQLSAVVTSTPSNSGTTIQLSDATPTQPAGASTPQQPDESPTEPHQSSSSEPPNVAVEAGTVTKSQHPGATVTQVTNEEAGPYRVQIDQPKPNKSEQYYFFLI